MTISLKHLIPWKEIEILNPWEKKKKINIMGHYIGIAKQINENKYFGLVWFG